MSNLEGNRTEASPCTNTVTIQRTIVFLLGTTYKYIFNTYIQLYITCDILNYLIKNNIFNTLFS